MGDLQVIQNHGVAPSPIESVRVVLYNCQDFTHHAGRDLRPIAVGGHQPFPAEDLEPPECSHRGR